PRSAALRIAKDAGEGGSVCLRRRYPGGFGDVPGGGSAGDCRTGAVSDRGKIAGGETRVFVEGDWGAARVIEGSLRGGEKIECGGAANEGSLGSLPQNTSTSVGMTISSMQAVSRPRPYA